LRGVVADVDADISMADAVEAAEDAASRMASAATSITRIVATAVLSESVGEAAVVAEETEEVSADAASHSAAEEDLYKMRVAVATGKFCARINHLQYSFRRQQSPSGSDVGSNDGWGEDKGEKITVTPTFHPFRLTQFF
jgi:hypothetical protein